MLRNAVAGVNIIPTALLGLVLLYWIIAIIGLLDLDFFDFDLDLEGADSANPFHALAIYLHMEEIPSGLVVSLVVLNFWIISMLVCYIPVIKPGGLINAVLLIPVMAASIVVTKWECMPLSGIFRHSFKQANRRNQVVCHLCTLLCDMEAGKLGQAEIERNGASIVVNVKSEAEGVTFSKNEEAVILKQDKNKNLYYIIKVKGK